MSDVAPVPVSVPAHPGSSSAVVSRRMSGARRRDTAPELALRAALHRSGLRYRVAWPVPGQRRRTIDIAFTRAQLAVFVDGCFWHCCPAHGVQPKANAEWWTAKLAANTARDRDTDRLLVSLGWHVLRLWEHESPEAGLERVRDSLADCIAQADRLESHLAYADMTTRKPLDGAAATDPGAP